MLNRLVRLDRMVMDRLVEPVAWRLSRWVSPFSLARFFAVVFMAAVLAGAINDPSMWNVLLGVLGVVFVPHRMWDVTRIEKAVERGLANEERHKPFGVFFRASLLVVNAAVALLVLLTWVVTPLTVGNLGWTLHLYLSACERPPPQPETSTHLATEGSAG